MRTSTSIQTNGASRVVPAPPKNITLQPLHIINQEGYSLSGVTITVVNTSSQEIDREVTDSKGCAILKLDPSASSIRLSRQGSQQVEIPVKILDNNPIELKATRNLI